VLLLPERSTVWYTRGVEEVDALYEALGPLDDAGESRIVSPQGILTLEEGTLVLVTAARGAEWLGWGRRPKGLVGGVLTSGRHVGREVRFVAGECKVVP
jgi:hypothetical protein